MIIETGCNQTQIFEEGYSLTVFKRLWPDKPALITDYWGFLLSPVATVFNNLRSVNL